MGFDLSLYLILDPTLCGGADGMIRTATTAAANGATLIQLRSPNWSRDQLTACGKALREALRPFHVPLIVNNDPIACVEIDADGVHIGQSDMSPSETREIVGHNRIIGLSVSNLQELKAVPIGLVDYLGVGPVFSTPTKQDAAPPMGIGGLRQIVQGTPLPCVAIGGIHRGNATSVMQTEAAGIAVISAICAKPDTENATANLASLVSASKRKLS